MADHFPAEITIGGRIPRRLLAELAEHIAFEGVGLDWQYALDEAAVCEAIEAADAQGQTVRFTEDEACCGEFEELEHWLFSHGIDFDRHNAARFEHDGENVYARSGMSLVSMNCDQSGNDLVPAEEIRKILADQSTPSQKLARITRLAAAPPGLTPVTVMDGAKRRS